MVMCRVPVDSPDRFRMELLFSPGASHDPYSVVPLKQDHTLPISSRSHLHEGTLPHFELWKKYQNTRRVRAEVLQVVMVC